MTNEQLVIRIKAGEDVSENMLQLWQQNQGFIGKIAVKYQGYEDIEDLKQQGYIGLCHAVENYNPDEGVPFISYAAFWIRQSIQKYIENCGKLVRIPNNLRSELGKYKKFVITYQLWFGKSPTDQESCYYLDIDKEKLENIKKAVVMDSISSLDVPIGEDDDGSMYELLPGGENPESEVVERMQQEQLRKELWSMVDELSENQSEVIRMRYQEEKTLKEIGEQIGKNVNQTKSIETKALISLREPRRARILQSLMYGDIYSKALRGNGLNHFNQTWTSSTEFAALGFW